VGPRAGGRWGAALGGVRCLVVRGFRERLTWHVQGTSVLKVFISNHHGRLCILFTPAKLSIWSSLCEPVRRPHPSLSFALRINCLTLAPSVCGPSHPSSHCCTNPTAHHGKDARHLAQLVEFRPQADGSCIGAAVLAAAAVAGDA
jgi:hypothetical protein